MKKNNTKGIITGLILGIILIVLSITLCGCTQVDRVSTNLSQEADNFNITRRIVVMNARTDTILFELVGNFSLQNNNTNELEIVCEVGQGKYKKHFIYLNSNTIYVVEDVSGAYVDRYHYEVNYIPEMLQPLTITNND